MTMSRVWAPCALVAIPLAVSAGSEMNQQDTTMHFFSDQSVVEAAKAKLSRLEEGVYSVVATKDLEPGHAVTMWWVVFNRPDLCSDGECGEDDVFNLDQNGEFVLNADGSPPMNMEMIEKVGISAIRADGRVVAPDGSATYKAFLPVGDTSDAAFGEGMIDASKAEIHLVLRDHMAPSADKLSEALNSINGACDAEWPNAPCDDVQFAVFKPLVEMN